MIQHLHHTVKAGLDFVNVSVAIAVVTNYLPFFLALPSFIYSTILLIEWVSTKIKK